MHEKNESKL
jgi:GTPase SAR1 family protein